MAHRWLACAAICAIATPARAHRMDLDLVALDGGRLRAEVYYSDGRPAAGAEILVRDGAGKEILRGVADPQGKFEFQPPVGVAFEVEARHEGGHRAARRVEPGKPLPPATPPERRGEAPIGKLIAGVAVIAVLSFLIRRMIRGRRAPS